MPKPYRLGNGAGEPSRLSVLDRGESGDSEEDFFASSPTANLAGDNEEGQVYGLFFGGCEVPASQPLSIF
jgi:hypothetical protein